MKKILIFLLAIVVLSVCSCRSSKIDTNIHQTSTEHKQTEQTDSSAYKMQADVFKNIEQMKEMIQQFEFTWQKTNYSLPDSTGKQYPTSTETAAGSSTKHEKETYNEQLQVQMQQMQETLLKMKEQLDRQEKIDTKVVEEVEYIPPWVKVAITLLCVALAFSLYKNIRKWKQ